MFVDETDLAVWISDRSRNVSAVDRSHEGQIFPVLPLQVFVVDERGRLVRRLVGHLVEVAQGEGPLADVDGLEDAAVAVDHLADGIRNLEVHQVFQVVAGLARLPLFRRDDLEEERSKFSLRLSGTVAEVLRSRD